jgi:signal transduction histidine kinase
MLRRLSTGVLLDLAILTGFIVIGWFSTGATAAAEPYYVYTPRDGVFIALLALVTLPALAWRRWPALAFLISFLALTAMWTSGYHTGGLPLILIIGMYWVAASGSVRELVASLGVAFVCVTALLWTGGAPFTLVEWTASAVSLGVAVALGRASRLRGEVAEARAHAAEEASLRRAGEERLRVSGELHDIVGHSLGIIAVQAGVGHHLMEQEPARAAEALDHISRISRRSLDEMRSVVATLRSDPAAYEAPHGLDDVADLVATARETGLQVRLTLPDDPDSMPRQIGAAVYRVLREALTNVIRHARASAVQVTVELGTTSVDVSVRDDGEGATLTAGVPSQSGHGIAVMRERVEALGGTLTAGPHPEGGFIVTATLPAEPIR